MALGRERGARRVRAGKRGNHMTVWIIVLASVAMSLLLLCYLAAKAPAGYEDKKGWHPGEPSDEADRPKDNEANKLVGTR